MRFDKIFTLGVVKPSRSLFSNRCTNGIPILMYHGVGNRKERNSYFEVNTRPEVFRRHLDELHSAGYRVLSLRDLIPLLADPPVKVACLTFDDGYQDFLTEAFPLIKERGFSATVFLVTAYIGTKRMTFNGSPCLTWEEVGQLHLQGVEFGSHTVHHPLLVDMPLEEIEQEIRQSKTSIEERLGATVNSFAYPYAFPQGKRQFSSTLEKLLSSAGYQIGVTTRIGLAGTDDGGFFLRRLPFNSFDDREFFRAKLAGHYDWVGSIQTLKKQGQPGWKKRRTRARNLP